MLTAPRRRLAIMGASGKLAFATLSALLEHDLLPASSIVCTTSASPSDSPQAKRLLAKGVTVRYASFDSSKSIADALHDVDALFLVSSPRIALDFPHATQTATNPGKMTGREHDHITAIEAACAAGVKHTYYTSLGFARPSKASVMRAHIATEIYLETHHAPGASHMGWTILREGLYNESWPLYLGHWRLRDDSRGDVLLAGDGKVNWTAIADLGLANALLLAEPCEKWASRTVYLSNTSEAMSVAEVARLVGEMLGRQVNVQLVSRREHEDYYIAKRGMDQGNVKWWASTYDALTEEECLIKDDTLTRLLESRQVTPTPMRETIREMLQR